MKSIIVPSSRIKFHNEGILQKVDKQISHLHTKRNIYEMISSNCYHDYLNKPRKRARLSHLTPEEKLIRRKMKNRLSAQTARDRKKEKMDVLDSTVKLLEEQNSMLIRQNAQLKQQIKRLIASHDCKLEEESLFRDPIVQAPNIKNEILIENSCNSINEDFTSEECMSEASASAVQSDLVTPQQGPLLTLFFAVLLTLALQLLSPKYKTLQMNNSITHVNRRKQQRPSKIVRVSSRLKVRRLSLTKPPIHPPHSY